MSDLQRIDDAIAIKRAFGSFAILDEFEEWEIPSIIQFARIISNYLMMQEKIKE